MFAYSNSNVFVIKWPAKSMTLSKDNFGIWRRYIYGFQPHATASELIFMKKKNRNGYKWTRRGWKQNEREAFDTAFLFNGNEKPKGMLCICLF